MYLKPLLTLFLSSYLLACASTPDPNAPAAYADDRGGSDCIFEGTVRDYQVLDEANLVVTAAARQQYHIELVQRAHGLRSTWQIGLTSPTSRICPGFSELVFDDSVIGPERIPIRSITALTPEQYDDLLIRFGRKEPEIEHTPEPEESEGAEVEELD